MNAMTDRQVDKLLEDISSIKNAISRNREAVRLILLPVHFRLLYLLVVLSVIGFSLAFHLLMRDHGSFEAIPAPNSSFDLVWSQDAILHSGRRERVISEVARVLKPGGRMIVSDIVLNRPLPESARNDAGLYAACIAGAMLRRQQAETRGRRRHDNQPQHVVAQGFHELWLSEHLGVILEADKRIFIAGQTLEKAQAQRRKDRIGKVDTQSKDGRKQKNPRPDHVRAGDIASGVWPCGFEKNLIKKQVRPVEIADTAPYADNDRD